jgi:DNA-directed RNA polymerase specialized sigma24 family protein
VATEVAMRMAVQKALGSLTDRQRAVLVLRVFDDLSEAQVAQVPGCAVGTVKSTMARAVARLREDPRISELMERKAWRTAWTGSCVIFWMPPLANRPIR